MSFLPHISNSLNGYIFLAVNRIAYLYWFPENCSGNIECNSDLCSATESWGMVIWYYVLFLFPSFWLVLFGYWFGLWWKLSCLMQLCHHWFNMGTFLCFFLFLVSYLFIYWDRSYMQLCTGRRSFSLSGIIRALMSCLRTFLTYVFFTCFSYKMMFSLVFYFLPA